MTLKGTDNIDPETATLKQLLAYEGRPGKITKSNFRVLKKSSKFLIPLVGGTILASYLFAKVHTQVHIFGKNNKGGEVLDIKSNYTPDDISYTREMQRMNYLSEPDRPREGNVEVEMELKRR